MSRIKDPGSAWRLPVTSGPAGRGKERLDHGRHSEMGGDDEARSSARRFTPSGSRDVLQLDGLRALSAALRT